MKQAIKIALGMLAFVTGLIGMFLLSLNDLTQVGLFVAQIMLSICMVLCLLFMAYGRYSVNRNWW